MASDRKNLKVAIVVLGDVVIVPLAYLAAYIIRFADFYGFFEKFPLVFLAFMTGAYLAVFYFFGLYAFERPLELGGLFQGAAIAAAFAGLFSLLLKYALFLIPIGRGILAIASVLVFLMVLAWRAACRRLFRILIKPRRVVVLSAGKSVAQIGRALEAYPQEFEVVGILSDEATAQAGENLEGRILPGEGRSFEEFSGLVANGAIDLIVTDESLLGRRPLAETILRARMRGIDVANTVDVYEKLTGRIPVGYIKDENWFLKLPGFAVSGASYGEKIKRIMDVAISGPLLALSLPLWPVISLLIKLDSRGPILYRQKRIGRNESIFLLHKFRSMIEAAEEDRPLWASADDRRITRVGRLLRAIHADELPQLWNVLRGDMSLVGPRPERPEFVEALKKEIPYYSLRHVVKPGLTGWAQINFPYAASLADSREKLEFDLYYISRRSLVLDLRILARTVQSLFGGNPKKRT
jgi:exopolysaccharide biosynthesis polyprenyl glycosylphosphotransferase